MFPLYPIDSLKIGDLFIFPNKKTVYVYNGYNRFTKKYAYHKFYDISAFYEKKKGTLVQINFPFYF